MLKLIKFSIIPSKENVLGDTKASSIRLFNKILQIAVDVYPIYPEKELGAFHIRVKLVLTQSKAAFRGGAKKKGEPHGVTIGPHIIPAVNS